MSEMTNIAIAPAHPLGQGRAIRGGHIQAFRAQPIFKHTDRLKVLSNANPWRLGSTGGMFFDSVLSQKPRTVADAIALGMKNGFSELDVQGHLRWLFTWTGPHLEVNGKVWRLPVVAIVATPKAKAKKK
jgi:hypothetical protein